IELPARRSRRVRKRIVVHPDDGVASPDGERLWGERGAVHHDRVNAGLVRSRRGLADACERTRRDGWDDQRAKKSSPHLPTCAWTCFACSRCATKAGRTLTMRAFSSAFCVLGTSVWSMASMTAWW